ncbi:MAG TPA: ABC transporter ATP-binding protein [Acidimicrobiaceae bacterium]|nr:ABC transporter ATP-binding protein [Acidimicrobiaceae bacterium]
MTLEFQRVWKRYRQGGEDLVALADVSLDVCPGEFVAVVGPSGSGKSTLLHIAGGLDDPDSGVVTVDGVPLAALGAGARARLRRRDVGFVFQFFQLIPSLSVIENIELPLLFDGHRSTRDAALTLLGAVGLAGKGARFPGELSGGEMQRVAIARALVAGPPLILADEPTGNLDSVTGAEVLDVLTTQVRQHGAALVLVTHDPVAAGLADRVVAMRDGRIQTP